MTSLNYQDIKQQLAKRPRQEQRLLLVFVFLFSAFVLMKLLISPFMTQHYRQIAALNEKQQLIEETELKIHSLTTSKATLLGEQKQLKIKNAELDKKLGIQSLTQDTDNHDTALLRSLLLQGGGDIELLSLNRIIKNEAFHHLETIQLRFSANYFDTLAFLLRLKQSHFLWDIQQIDFQLQTHPLALVNIQFSTGKESTA